MQIPFLSFFGKKENPEYFLALLLRDEKVSAVIFEKIADQIKVLGKHDEYLEKTIEETSLNDILDILDKTISTAETPLPKEIETQKTVFGLKENWVEDAKIKKDYLALLKKISEALGLVPIGFLVIHEAITHLLQQEEGAPVSAVLVELGSKNITISILRAGRIVGTKRTSIEDSPAKTTDNVLHYFEECEILPSRIIIFNSVNNEKIQQEFVGHSWSKNLPFLHVPQITILPADFDAKSVLAGAATQMGLTIKDNNFLGEIEKKSETHEKHEIELKQEEFNQENPTLNNEKEDEKFKENFGFIKNEDVAEIKKEKTKPDFLEPEHKVSRDPQDLKSTEEFSEENEIIDRNEAELIMPSEKKPSFSLNVNLTSKLNTFKKIVKNINFFSFLISKRNKKIIFIPIFLLGFFLSVLLLYYFTLRATIIININPKIIQNSQDLTFSIDKDTDFKKNILNAKSLSTTEEGTLSLAATGKKEVGEKAKGTVTIYSRYTEEKTLPSGTILTSSNDLQFTLDSAVKLASASADASATPVAVKASVTAKAIGKESNLPSGAKFQIGSESSTTIIAKNEAAFSGGTKRETTVFGKADLDKLTVELPKNLEEQAKKSLTQKASSDETLLPVFTKTSFANKDFGQKLGDETNTVTIKGSVTYQGLTYKKNSLDEYFKKFIQNGTKNNLVLKDGIKYEVKNIQVKNEKEIFATVNIKAILLPKIDLDTLREELTGKSFNKAKEKIKELPQVSDIEIALWPKLSLLPNKLPSQPKNITITVKENE